MLDVCRRGYRFQLDGSTGRGWLRREEDELDVWTGTLHPSLLTVVDGRRRLLVPTGRPRSHSGGGTADRWSVELDYDGRASGRLQWDRDEAGLLLTRFELESDQPLPIVDLFFGMTPLEGEAAFASPDPEQPQWPDWRADGFCVPNGRPAPSASFFRRWDLGNASVALGNFGPALGTPYGAAFPRPVWSAAFGGDAGWLVAGVGGVPDGAMTLEVRNTSFALRLRYREDLWGAPSLHRHWNDLLRLSWDTTAMGAFEEYVGSFPARQSPLPASAGAATVNTWGDFMRGRFDLSAQARKASELGAEVLVIDEGWERQDSDGVPHPERFQHFDDNLAQVRAQGLRIGLWQSVGWIDDPASVGLTSDDLLCGADGVPRRTNWAINPRDPHLQFALDPSSSRTRDFLRERTHRILAAYSPATLKLDFAYGLPGPDAGVPRDPRLRGERYGMELIRIVSEAVREHDPEVAIVLYGIHPLHLALGDVLSLDDMGDHGAAHEADGHRSWSVWAALAASQGVVVNGSSGYGWEQDREVVLDTFVLGAPGAVLPLLDGRASARQLALRRAVNRWHRRTARWEPRWLDSETGGLDREPRLRSAARLEDGRVRALVLRDGSDLAPGAVGLDLAAEGDWGLVALGDAHLDDLRSGEFAIVPATAGRLRIGAAAGPWRYERHDAAGRAVEERPGPIEVEAAERDLDDGLEGWIVRSAAASR